MHVRTPCVGTLGGLQTAPDVVVGPRREWRKPKPVMNGLKKSDEAVRPVRAANKGARACAESPEERVSTKGNPERQSTRRTQCRASVPQAAARIRKAAERNPKERLTALFPPYYARRAAPGVPRLEAECCGGRRRRYVGHVWRGSGRAPARPAPAPAQGGSVPGAAGSAGRDTQARTAGHDRSGSRRWRTRSSKRRLWM